MGFGTFTELVSRIGWDWTDGKVLSLRLLQSLEHHSPVVPIISNPFIFDPSPASPDWQKSPCLKAVIHQKIECK